MASQATPDDIGPEKQWLGMSNVDGIRPDDLLSSPDFEALKSPQSQASPGLGDESNLATALNTTTAYISTNPHCSVTPQVQNS